MDVRRPFTTWAPVAGIVCGLAWFVWAFVPPSVVKAPPAQVELVLLPGGLGVLFLLTLVGLVVSRGRSKLCWVAAGLLGLQVLMAVLLLGFLHSLSNF